MSLAQEVVLKEFIAGAYAALEKARSGEVTPEERIREIPASIRVFRNSATGQDESHAVRGMNVPQQVYAFPKHDIVLTEGSLDQAFDITIPEAVLATLPEADREVLGQVRVHSQFMDMGYSEPTILVPAVLGEALQKIMKKTGLEENPTRGGYHNLDGYRFAEHNPPPHVKAAPSCSAVFTNEDFEKVSNALLGQSVGKGN